MVDQGNSIFFGFEIEHIFQYTDGLKANERWSLAIANCLQLLFIFSFSVSQKIYHCISKEIATICLKTFRI